MSTLSRYIEELIKANPTADQERLGKIPPGRP
jgi:hypothetical protein